MANLSGLQHSAQDAGQSYVPYNERVWVTVDDANLNKRARHEFGRRINWKRLLAPVHQAPWRRVEVVSSSNWMSQGRQQYLEKVWGADVWLATKNADAIVGGSLLRGAHEAQHLILCAGDGGYADVVDFLRSKGVIVDVWAFAKGFSPELGDLCSDLRILGPEVLRPVDHERPPRKCVDRVKPWTLPRQGVVAVPPSINLS